MKHILIQLVCLLLSSVALGTTYTLDGKEDFGGTFSGAYDTILCDVPLNYIELDSGIFISNGRQAYIDMGNDTIVYHVTQNTSFGGAGRYAMLLEGDSSYAKNILMYAYQASTDSGGQGLRIGGSVGITIDTVEAHAKGKDGVSCRTTGATLLKISNFNFTDWGTNFTDRTYQLGYGLWFTDGDPSVRGLDMDYGYWLENGTIDSGRFGGIAVVGQGDPIIMRNLNVTIDAHNDEYDSLTSGSELQGVQNAFGLAIDNYDSGSWIVACSVYTGTTHQGGRGISLNDHGTYTSNPSLDLCSSYFNVTTGYDDDKIWTYNGHALQSEEPNGGLSIYDNTFIGSCTTQVALQSYMGYRMTTVMFGHSGSPATEFFRNRVFADCPDGAYYATALGMDQDLTDTIISYNNYYEGRGPVIKFSSNPEHTRGAGGNSTFTGDTINRTGATFADSNFAGVDGAFGIENISIISTDNFATDIVFLDDTTIHLPTCATDRDFTLRKTMTYTVIGTDGDPIEDAQVQISNAYGVLATDTTDADGDIDSVGVAISYDQESMTDSTYNPFSIRVVYESDTTTEGSKNLYPNSLQADTIEIDYTPDVLENTTVFHANYSASIREYAQGIPREHLSASEVDSELVVVTQTNAGYAFACLRVYTDHLATLSDSALTSSGHLNNHTHMAMRGDTVITCGVRGSGKVVIRHTVTGGTITFLDSVYVDSTGVADTQGGIAFDGGGADMIIVGRNPDAMDTWAWLSDDAGETWSSNGYFVDYGVDTRVDVDEWGDSVSVMVFNNAVGRYIWHLWYDGAVVETDTATSASASHVRLYSHEVGRDGTIHHVFTTVGNPGNVVHVWRDPTLGTWSTDTVYTSSGTITAGNDFWVALSYSEFDGTLRLAYTEGATGPTDVVVKRWNQDNEQWSLGLTVSDASATDIHNLCGSRAVPTNHNSRGYFSFNELVGGTWSYQYVTVVDSSATQYDAVGGCAVTGATPITGGVTIQ